MHRPLNITILILVILLVNCIQNIMTITATEVQWSNGVFNTRLSLYFSFLQNPAKLLNIQLGNVLGMLIIPLEILILWWHVLSTSVFLVQVFKMYVYFVWNLPQVCHFSHIWKTFWETPGLKDKVNCNSLWGAGTPHALHCSVSVLFAVFLFTIAVCFSNFWQAYSWHKRGGPLQGIILKCSSTSNLETW